MRRFLSDLTELSHAGLRGTGRPFRVLEVGCGPGDLAGRLLSRLDSRFSIDYIGIDLSPEEIVKARTNCPKLKFEVASATALPFSDREFDLVIACEVLEHLHEPSLATAELARVTKHSAIVSVPWEPVWRIMNCIRGKYLMSWGNTPGHVQQFSRKKIRSLLRPRFQIVQEKHPFPWTMLLLHGQA